MQLILKKEIIVDENHSFLLADLTAKLKKWQSLFKETQNLLQCQEITEVDINAEIVAYRADLCE